MSSARSDAPFEVNFYYVIAVLAWLAMTVWINWQLFTGNGSAVSLGDMVLYALLFKIGRLGRRVRQTYEVSHDV